MKIFKSQLLNYKNFIKQILHFSRGEHLLLGLAILLAVLAAITEAVSFALLIPIMESAQNLAGFNDVPLLKYFSGLFSEMSQSKKLIWAASTLLVLTLLRGCLLYVAEITSYSLPPRVESRIKMRIFDSMYQMPISYVESMAAGELTNLTTTLPARVGATIRFIQLFCSSIIVVIINVAFMAIISPIVTLCMISILVILTWLYKRLSGSALGKAGEDLTQASSDFSQIFYNTINGVRLIRLSGALSRAKEQVDFAVRVLREANLTRLSIEATVFPFFATSIGVLFCLALIGAALLDMGESAKLLVTLVATIYLMSRLLGPITLINVARTNIYANKDALNTLEKFMESSQSLYEKDGSLEVGTFQHEICFHNVTFSYLNQERVAIQSFNLSIKKGEKIGLIGLSGSGKSTVIGLLCRIYKPDSGHITIDSNRLEELKIESWWRRIAVVMQDMVLMRDSIRLNLTQGLQFCPSDELIFQALETADALHIIEGLPDGLNTVLSDRGIGLSGGERQRLSLARALLRRPELLILDEATSNLDVQTENRIITRLAEQHPGLTTLVIAHRLGAVRSCDRVLVMHEGRVVSEIARNPALALGYPPLHELLPARP